MPTSFVTTVRKAPVFVFFSVTVTPGNTPPVESDVTPVIVPVVSCAAAVPHTTATSSIISPSLRMRDLLRLGSLSLEFGPIRTVVRAPNRVRAAPQRRLGRGSGDQHGLAERSRFEHRGVSAGRVSERHFTADQRVE